MYMFLELLILSIFMLFVGLYMYMYSWFWSVKWLIFDVGIFSFNYEVVVDWMGILFIYLIMMVSSMICGYSYWYVDLYLMRYYYMMVMFILSMLILVMSPNVFSMMLGWDGLGFISFCLVLYYYGSDLSVYGSLVTVMFNRFGDGLLLVSLSFLILGSGGGGMGFEVFWGGGYSLLLLLGLSTKSAQFPFMSWLPQAMAAPTPVSSLVHSSTLVTAGVYLMIRFSGLVYGNMVLLYFSLITTLYSGCLAVSEYDLKKVVAYSTLSQLGLMIYGICLGLSDLCYFHMICHAIFKSMMFMCCGVVIHEFMSQDLRALCGCLEILPISMVCLIGGGFSLMGMYFMTGYYSKDLILEGLFSFSMGVFQFMLIYLSMMMTAIYSVRLLLMMMVYGNYYGVYIKGGEGVMWVFLIVLFINSVSVGLVVSLLIEIYENYNYVSIMVKVILLFLLAVSFMFVLGVDLSFLGGANMDYYIYIKIFIFELNMMDRVDYYWMEVNLGYKVKDNLFSGFMVFKDYSIFLMVILLFVLLVFF